MHKEYFTNAIKALTGDTLYHYHYLDYFIAYILTKELIDENDLFGNTFYDPINDNRAYHQSCKDCDYVNVIHYNDFKNIFLNTPLCPKCNGFNIIIKTIVLEQADYTRSLIHPRNLAPLLMTNVKKYNDYYAFVKYTWQFQDFQSIPDDELLNKWSVIDF